MYARAKYLAKHCEPDTQALADTITTRFEHVLVVPAFDETADRLHAIATHCQAHQALLILVINAPTDAPRDSHARTCALLNSCRSNNTLIVDHVTQPLNPRAGVGLARKIGSDIALKLIAQGKVRQPWLYQTDADVMLPQGYFEQTLPREGTVIFPYRHVPAADSLAEPVALYDQHLAYYVAGLRFADSPYAYPTLGSTLAIHVDSYAAVRGFPRRNAGEDFHILNKLAKVAPVHCLSGPELMISARHSDRVPFGTGPSLTRLANLLAEPGKTARDVVSYDPQVFKLLRRTLLALKTYARTPATAQFGEAAPLLQQLGWHKVASRFAAPGLNATQRDKATTDWFDALRTLRFVHLAQAQYPDRPLLATLETLNWQI